MCRLEFDHYFKVLETFHNVPGPLFWSTYHNKNIDYKHSDRSYLKNIMSYYKINYLTLTLQSKFRKKLNKICNFVKFEC